MARWIIDSVRERALIYENAAGDRFRCGDINSGTTDDDVFRWVLRFALWAPGDRIVLAADGIEIPIETTGQN